MSKGLYDKYKIIKNETGKEVTDSYFVLKPDSDPAARAALRAYAAVTDNNELAKDLLHWANHRFVSCGCREAGCGHLFGGWEVEREELDPQKAIEELAVGALEEILERIAHGETNVFIFVTNTLEKIRGRRIP